MWVSIVVAARTFPVCKPGGYGRNVRLAYLPDEDEVSVEDADTSGEEGGAMGTKPLMKHVRVHLGTIRQEDIA